MIPGNSDAKATGVHAVEARTARANAVRRDSVGFLDFKLLIIGCSPVADLHEQTLAVRVYPGHLAFEFHLTPSLSRRQAITRIVTLPIGASVYCGPEGHQQGRPL